MLKHSQLRNPQANALTCRLDGTAAWLTNTNRSLIAFSKSTICNSASLFITSFESGLEPPRDGPNWATMGKRKGKGGEVTEYCISAPTKVGQVERVPSITCRLAYLLAARCIRDKVSFQVFGTLKSDLLLHQRLTAASFINHSIWRAGNLYATLFLRLKTSDDSAVKPPAPQSVSENDIQRMGISTYMFEFLHAKELG